MQTAQTRLRSSRNHGGDQYRYVLAGAASRQAACSGGGRKSHNGQFYCALNAPPNALCRWRECCRPTLSVQDAKAGGSGAPLRRLSSFVLLFPSRCLPADLSSCRCRLRGEATASRPMW